jgi:hypothetical protein
MDPILNIKDQTPLAQGASRLVFEHPYDPDLIVKVIRPEVVEDRFGNNTKWYKKRRRFGRFISYIREIQEFLAVSQASDVNAPFLQRIVGFARTDMGLGLVLEAVKWTDGTLAPSLRQLVHSGKYDAATEQSLENFFEALLDSPVIISDLNMANLVYTHTEDRGYYFVLIDGIGNNSLIRLKSLSRRINHNSKLGRFKKLRARIDRSKSRHPQPKS